MVPGDRPLITIGYKYNARKILYFIVTDNSGSTKTCITCLSMYPDQFTNFSFALLLVPLLCQKNLLLMRLTPTTNQDSLIWNWRRGGLLNVVGCGYV